LLLVRSSLEKVDPATDFKPMMMMFPPPPVAFVPPPLVVVSAPGAGAGAEGAPGAGPGGETAAQSADVGEGENLDPADESGFTGAMRTTVGLIRALLARSGVGVSMLNEEEFKARVAALPEEEEEESESESESESEEDAGENAGGSMDEDKKGDQAERKESRGERKDSSSRGRKRKQRDFGEDVEEGQVRVSKRDVVAAVREQQQLEQQQQEEEVSPADVLSKFYSSFGDEAVSIPTGVSAWVSEFIVNYFTQEMPDIKAHVEKLLSERTEASTVESELANIFGPDAQAFVADLADAIDAALE
jgi:hypothetical protein